MKANASLSRVTASFLAGLTGLAGLLALTVSLPAAAAISADQLRELLEDPGGNAGRTVVVDVRSKLKFGAEHIPGSLNIPVLGMEGRNIPPLGKVVVVWDGIDREAANHARDVLNQQPGVTAELLEGGYPAWRGHKGTHAEEGPGFTRGGPKGISYAQLMKVADEPDLVVIDLRAEFSTSATDLAELLPNARVVSPLVFDRRRMRDGEQEKDRHGFRRRDVPGWLKGRNLDVGALYVLVDDGDGRRSERVARRMTARGMGRVFVLHGGESALATSGQPVMETRTASAGAADG